MLNLETVLRTLTLAGAGAPAFRALFDQVVATLHPADQATAWQAYVDAMADNDEGHRRLQAKLAAASHG